jgi:CRISPR/Cas system-associated exonuclease Cas4 (RecB family)
MSYSWIRASEISDYAYCHRAWWLRRVHSVASSNTIQFEAGTKYHAVHNSLVERSVWARRVAYIAIFIAVTVLFFHLVSN